MDSITFDPSDLKARSSFCCCLNLSDERALQIKQIAGTIFLSLAIIFALSTTTFFVSLCFGYKVGMYIAISIPATIVCATVGTLWSQTQPRLGNRAYHPPKDPTPPKADPSPGVSWWSSVASSIFGSSKKVPSWKTGQPGLGFPNDSSSCFVNAAAQIVLIDEPTKRAVSQAALSWIKQYQTWIKFVKNPGEDLTDQETIQLASLLIERRLGVLGDVRDAITKMESFKTQSDAIKKLITNGEESLSEELSLDNAKSIVDLMKEAYLSSKKTFDGVPTKDRLTAFKKLIMVIGHQEIWDKLTGPLPQFDALIDIWEKPKTEDLEKQQTQEEATPIWESIKTSLSLLKAELAPMLDEVEQHSENEKWKQLKADILAIDENFELTIESAKAQKEKLEAILKSVADQRTRLTELRSLMPPNYQRGQQEAGELHAVLINLLPPKERVQFGILMSLKRQYVELEEVSIPEDFNLEAALVEVEAYGLIDRKEAAIWKEIKDWDPDNQGKSVCVHLLLAYLRLLKPNHAEELQRKKEQFQNAVAEASGGLQKIQEDAATHVEEISALIQTLQSAVDQYKAKEASKTTPETQKAFTQLENHFRLWKRRLAEQEGNPQDLSHISEDNTITFKEECQPEILLHPSEEENLLETYLQNGSGVETDDITFYKKTDGTIAMFQQLGECPILSEEQEINHFAIRFHRQIDYTNTKRDQTKVHVPFERTLKGKTYELYAVAQHLSGSVSYGHYTALVKKGDQWWLFDDATCSQATQSNLDQIGVKGSSFYYRLKNAS